MLVPALSHFKIDCSSNTISWLKLLYSYCCQQIKFIDMGRTANLLVAACLVLFHFAAGQHSSSQSQQHGQQQQQHHSPAYLIPSPVTRQSGLGGALSGLGGFGGGLGGGGGLSSILSGLGGLSGSSMLSTALPLLMVVGLGAMLVPLLGGAFFRESQKRGLPSVSPAFLEGVTDILEKFIKALDAVEKKY